MLFALDLGYPSSDLVVGGPKQDMIKQRIQEDFVKADVYFQTLNVQTIRQEKKYSVSETALKCDYVAHIFLFHLRSMDSLPGWEAP